MGRAALAQLTSEGGNGGGEAPAAFAVEGLPVTPHCPNPETQWNDGMVRSHVLIFGLARFLLSQDGKADLVS